MLRLIDIPGAGIKAYPAAAFLKQFFDALQFGLIKKIIAQKVGVKLNHYGAGFFAGPDHPLPVSSNAAGWDQAIPGRRW